MNKYHMSNISKELAKIITETYPGVIHNTLKSKGLWDDFLKATSFLDTFYDNISIRQRLYHINNNVLEVVICTICSIKPSKYSYKWGYIPCSKECSHIKRCKIREDNEEQRRKTLMEKYGTVGVMSIPRIKEKFNNTSRERYGDIYSRTDLFKNQMRDTCLEKYDVTNTSHLQEVKDKMANTNIKRYGSKSSFGNENVRQKFKNTCIERYGVDNPTKTEHVKQKIEASGVLYKDYKFPSGKIEKIQGYESYAIDILINNYDECDIIVGRKNITEHIGSIRYGADKQYFPDIFVKSACLVIEVKSSWTYDKHIENIRLKRQAILDAGYKFEIWIFDKTSNLKIYSILP